MEFITKGGDEGTMSVEAGMSQGSVLGPLLWNVTYDTIVKEGAESGVICYADDTLILASADTATKAVSRASL